MEETRNFEVDRENFLVVLEQALAPISAVLDGVARKFDLTANGPRDQYSAHDGPLDSWSMFTIMRQFQLIGIAVQELDVLVDRERALAGHRRYGRRYVVLTRVRRLRRRFPTLTSWSTVRPHMTLCCSASRSGPGCRPPPPSTKCWRTTPTLTEATTRAAPAPTRRRPSSRFG
jgi:hypothetical protein